jgi:type II secretory pathway component PulJ
MKKNMALLIMALLLCYAFSGMVVANVDNRMVAAAAEEEKEVKISVND